MKTRTIITLTAVLLSFCSTVLAQWIQTNTQEGGGVTSFTMSGTNLFAGTYGRGVLLSTNNGTNWTAVNTGLMDTVVFALAVSDTNLFAGTRNGGVFRSTDNGNIWLTVNAGLTNTYVQSLAVSRTNLFAGTRGGGVFLSTNKGASWTAVDSGLIGFHSNEVHALAVSGTNLFAGTYADVFLSTNNGTSWRAVDSGLVWAQPGVIALVASGADMFAGLNGSGVFRSTNNGTSWTGSGGGGFVHALVVSGTNLFAGTYASGVFLSTNNGTSWTAVNTGLGENLVNALAVSGTNLFAGTSGYEGRGGGVWRRPLSEMITSVAERASGELPGSFELMQNYPNPFNPATKIRYQISNISHVTLKVFDVLGREVATLVNEERKAGEQSVQFNAQNLSSGIYYYRLNAGGSVAVRKMLLLR